MRKPFVRGAACLLALTAGCFVTPPLQENPTVVAQANYDYVWESTIRVLDKYFDIAYENRYDGRIETVPQSAATLLEPWYHDSVGCYDRLLASLQTVRRRGFVLIQPTPTGGFTITIEVYKELEDLHGPMYTNFAGGSFIASIEPTREQVVTSPIRPSAGWISMGRDLKLESKIIDELHKELDGAQVVVQ